MRLPARLNAIASTLDMLANALEGDGAFIVEPTRAHHIETGDVVLIGDRAEVITEATTTDERIALVTNPSDTDGAVTHYYRADVWLPRVLTSGEDQS